MKQEKLTYEGFLNNMFCFVRSNGQKIAFSKSKKELIVDFKLKDIEGSICKTFQGRYFVESTMLSDVYILCDLEEIVQ